MTRRPATLADARRLADIYAAYDTIELGQPEMELADLEVMLAVDSERIAVEVEDRIVGFAELADNGEAETLVDPSYDGALDLQRELLAWLVQRATERGIARLEHWAGTSPDGAARLLTETGFEHVRTMWRMGRSINGDLPTPVWPDGVALRTFERERDAREVWQVVMTCFAGAFGSHQRSLEEWSTFVLDRGYDVVCAVDNDVIIGVATTGDRTGDGHVGQLAVLPEHRGRGLGLALLQECFRRDAAAGYRATTLTVDGENDKAKRLYENAGMRVQTEYRRWERDV